MNKRETEVYIIKYLDGYLTSKGFKHKKSQKTQIEYYRKFDNDNFEKFSLSTINYYDSHRLRFGFGKRIGVVEEVMTKINEVIPFSNPPYKKDSHTLGFGYNSYYGINQDGLPDYMKTEQDINNNVQKVIDFTEKMALPFLAQLNDLREIDKLINGEGENFWDDDWKKTFNLAGRFYLRRLIIAKLSGRKDYNDFIENHLQKIEKLFEEKNKKLDRNDLSNEFVYCIHLLKNITPLY